MTELGSIWLGLGFLGLVIISLSGYVIWEIRVRDGEIRRAADEDKKIIEKGEKTEKQVADEIKSIVNPLISAISALAGITIAAVFIVIALSISGNIEFEDVNNTAILAKRLILYIVLALAGIASVCWLFVLEQLTQMKAPSITNKRLFKFHRYNIICGFLV